MLDSGHRAQRYRWSGKETQRGEAFCVCSGLWQMVQVAGTADSSITPGQEVAFGHLPEPALHSHCQVPVGSSWRSQVSAHTATHSHLSVGALGISQEWESTES